MAIATASGDSPRRSTLLPEIFVCPNDAPKPRPVTYLLAIGHTPSRQPGSPTNSVGRHTDGWRSGARSCSKLTAMMSDGRSRDEQYVGLLLGGLRSVRDYKPKLGKGRSVGVDDFIDIYGSDPLYHWVGFDSPLMYAAHKAAGSMTSLYRNLGTGCEHLFKQVLKDQMGLTDSDISWSYIASSSEIAAFEGADQIPFDPGNVNDVAGVAEDIEEAEERPATRKGKQNTLDGRFDLASIRDKERFEAASDWVGRLRQDREVAWEPLGAVFEIRQGYKSMDSKRQAADIANAAQALTKSRLPVLVVMSQQIDPVLVTRYRASGWGILRGLLDERDSLVSTFAFFEDVLGYDLVSFFERNHERVRAEVDDILRSILEAA